MKKIIFLAAIIYAVGIFLPASVMAADSVFPEEEAAAVLAGEAEEVGKAS